MIPWTLGRACSPIGTGKSLGLTIPKTLQRRSDSVLKKKMYTIIQCVNICCSITIIRLLIVYMYSYSICYMVYVKYVELICVHKFSLW